MSKLHWLLSRSFTSLKPSSAPKKSLSLLLIYVMPMFSPAGLSYCAHDIWMQASCDTVSCAAWGSGFDRREELYVSFLCTKATLFFVFQKASELALIATKNLCTNDKILLRGEASLFSLVCVDESTLCTLSILVFALDILFPFFFSLQASQFSFKQENEIGFFLVFQDFSFKNVNF